MYLVLVKGVHLRDRNLQFRERSELAVAGVVAGGAVACPSTALAFCGGPRLPFVPRKEIGIFRFLGQL